MGYDKTPYNELVKKKSEKTTLRLINEANLTQTQSDIIKQYYNALRLGKKIACIKNNRTCYMKPKSYKTFESYVRVAIKFGEYLKKDYKKATKIDVENYQIYLSEKVSTKTGKNMKKETIDLYSIKLKVFYIWLYNGQEIPSVVEDIQRVKENPKPIPANQVLTPDEVYSMIYACHRNRDKAIISLMYETGCRVGELVNCTVGDFINYGRYAKVRLQGKTGLRTVAISDCIVFIEQWLNEHPYNNDCEAPLFTSVSCNNFKNRLTPRGIADIIKRSANAVGISKRYNPHWFRHSGLDHYTKKYHANERDLKIRAGWSMKSKMHMRYIHYGEDEVNENYLKAKGIKTENTPADDSKLEPKICYRCFEMFPNDEKRWLHSPTSKYCNCGQVLDINELQKVEKLQKDANTFTDILIQQPLPAEVDNSKGMDDALFQTMLKNPLLIEKFKQILTENELV